MFKHTVTLFGLIGLTLSLSANAAPVTLVGDTVNYVYDDTQSAINLFGTPLIQGDTVLFIPPNFRAESANGAGQISAAANFIFDNVYTTNGMDLDTITVTEDGDYNIDNGDGVSATLRLTIVNNDDFLAGGRNDLVSFSASGDQGPANWDLEASLDPVDEYGSPVSDLRVTIQNTLTADTDAQGELAWIQKKLSFVATTEVPVPAAAWLFGSALVGLAGIKRKK